MSDNQTLKVFEHAQLAVCHGVYGFETVTQLSSVRNEDEFRHLCS